MKPVLAHGGGIDELLLLAGLFGLIWGVVRLADSTKRGMRRLMGVPIVLVGLGLGALPFVLDALTPSMAKVRIPSAARLEIVSPLPGATVSKPAMEITMRLTSAKLTLDESTALRPDRGHLHLSVDGEEMASWIGLEGPLEIDGLKSGTHLLQIEFVATDHGPFAPPITAITQFVITGGT